MAYANVNPDSLTWTIASAASASVGINLRRETLVGLIVPSGYSAANMAFAVSEDGVTYYPLFRAGARLEVAVTAATHNSLTPADYVNAAYVQAISPATAVNAALVITAIVRKVAP